MLKFLPRFPSFSFEKNLSSLHVFVPMSPESESENAIFGSSRGQITSFQLKLWSEVITHLAKLGDCDLLLSVRVEEGEGLPEAVDVLGGDLPVEAPHGGGQPGLLLDAGPGLSAHRAKGLHSAFFFGLCNRI